MSLSQAHTSLVAVGARGLAAARAPQLAAQLPPLPPRLDMGRDAHQTRARTLATGALATGCLLQGRVRQLPLLQGLSLSLLSQGLSLSLLSQGQSLSLLYRKDYRCLF